MNICLQIRRIYEKVICCVGMSNRLTKFHNTIGVKQRCPLSPTLFGLCIDELDEMDVKFVEEEDVHKVCWPPKSA